MPADQDLADDLRSTAKVRPESVDVSTLVDLTTSSDDVARTIALGALKEVGSERPDRVRGSVDAIGARLSDGNASVRKNALFALVPLAEADPDVVSPYLRAIGDLLDGDKTANNAVHVFKHLSEAFPEAAGDYVDRIVPLLQADNEYTRIQAAGCLRNLARPKRETIREYVPELTDALSDPASDVRNAAVVALGRIAESDPAAVRYSIDDIVALVDDRSKYTRASVAYAVSQVAKEYPDDARTVADALGPLLSDPHATARHNTATAFHYLSEPSPAVLDGYRTELERLADDDESSVYASKCLDKLDAWADGPSGSETRVYDPDR